MTEFKGQINMRGGPDLNMSFSFTHIIDTVEEADNAGHHDALMISAYMQGYSRAVDEMNAEASS